MQVPSLMAGMTSAQRQHVRSLEDRITALETQLQAFSRTVWTHGTDITTLRTARQDGDRRLDNFDEWRVAINRDFDNIEGRADALERRMDTTHNQMVTHYHRFRQIQVDDDFLTRNLQGHHGVLHDIRDATMRLGDFDIRPIPLYLRRPNEEIDEEFRQMREAMVETPFAGVEPASELLPPEPDDHPAVDHAPGGTPVPADYVPAGDQEMEEDGDEGNASGDEGMPLAEAEMDVGTPISDHPTAPSRQGTQNVSEGSRTPQPDPEPTSPPRQTTPASWSPSRAPSEVSRSPSAQPQQRHRGGTSPSPSPDAVAHTLAPPVSISTPPSPSATTMPPEASAPSRASSPQPSPPASAVVPASRSQTPVPIPPPVPHSSPAVSTSGEQDAAPVVPRSTVETSQPDEEENDMDMGNSSG